RTIRDSGTIMVGASTSTDRSPLPTIRIQNGLRYGTNFGARVDCYAIGENIETTAKNGTPPYTPFFDGTSGASAIIAGAAISVQSIAEATYGFRLSPQQMRSILSNNLYGTPSLNGRDIDKIGVMPDLRRIIDMEL